MIGGNLGYSRSVDFDLYQPYNRILFLSDGVNDQFGFYNTVAKNEGALSLGQRVAERFPDKTVVQTDFNIEGMQKVGNLTQMHLDNTQNFPFEQGSFDLIVLRKGLCLCYKRCPCAGFTTKYESSKNFFSNVIKSLNLKNPSSMAILHGQERADPSVVARWMKIAEELEREFDVDITFAHAPEGIGFRPTDKGIDAQPTSVFGDGMTTANSSDQPVLGEFNSIIIRPRDQSLDSIQDRL